MRRVRGQFEWSIERDHHLGSGQSVTKGIADGRLARSQVGRSGIFGPSGPLIVTEIVWFDDDLGPGRDPDDPRDVEHRAQRLVRDMDDEGPPVACHDESRFHTTTSPTGRRRERVKPPPRVNPTGIRQVWSHSLGNPRMSAMAA